jgi:hypothetical protein
LIVEQTVLDITLSWHIDNCACFGHKKINKKNRKVPKCQVPGNELMELQICSEFIPSSVRDEDEQQIRDVRSYSSLNRELLFSGTWEKIHDPVTISNFGAGDEITKEDEKNVLKRLKKTGCRD